MQDGQPSETAYLAAQLRARHHVLDGGMLFPDPLAIRFLRPADARALEAGRGPRSGLARRLRLIVVARHRLAEDTLAAAVQRGVRQYVLLGAGLDSVGFRALHAQAGVRTFELDHPATQARKREVAAAAGLQPPASLVFVEVDFAHRDFWERLVESGFDATAPAVFAMLGVSMYLPERALMATLHAIAERAARGSEIVFDYLGPTEGLRLVDRFASWLVARQCERLGEPWLSRFDPADLQARLGAMGYSRADSVPSRQLVRDLLAPGRTGDRDAAATKGTSHVMHAVV